MKRSAKRRAATTWDKALAKKAIEGAGSHERDLLRRLAEARGQRVPLSELAGSFGLPESASVEQDFSGLSAFCKPGAGVTLPVVASATDSEHAWYWMSPWDSAAFVDAFDELDGGVTQRA